MKIVYLHQYFNTPAMSGGTRSYEFARRLVAAGHDVHMITSDRKGGGKPYETEEAGIRITWIPVSYSNSMGPFARIRSFLAFAIKSARFAAQSKADIIFATSTPLTIAIPGVYAKWRQRIPMVFEVRDLWPEMPIAMGALRDPLTKTLAKWLERFAYSNASHIIALSPGMRDGIVAVGYPKAKITVIPNAADIERFCVPPEQGKRFRSNYEWLGDRKLVLYTGTLGQVNGVSYLASVAAEMLKLDSEIRFLVVGSGKDEDTVRVNSRQIGVLNKNFYMLSSVPKSEVPALLSAADICTSLFIDLKQMWVNSANKFFDALAAGRPVAINYGGWQEELLSETGAGFSLDPADPAAAAIKLHDFLADPGRLARAGTSAKNLAATRFDRDDFARRFETVLTRVHEAHEEHSDARRA